jgi:hypothetical protein
MFGLDVRRPNARSGRSGSPWSRPLPSRPAIPIVPLQDVHSRFAVLPVKCPGGRHPGFHRRHCILVAGLPWCGSIRCYVTAGLPVMVDPPSRNGGFARAFFEFHHHWFGSYSMVIPFECSIDCTSAARLLMRMQADLVLFVEKRERLKNRESA